MYRVITVCGALFLSGCASNDAPPASLSEARVEVEAPAATQPGEIEFAEAPVAPQQEVPVQANAPVVVCQLERRTGTNRKVRVCREQTSATDAADAREVFDSLRRQQRDLEQ